MSTAPRGLDYSFEHPDPSLIRADGYTAVGRYLSGVKDKDISLSEAKALHAHGLGIWLVWERTASRALGSEAIGAYDARQALAQANSVGYPAACPIFFAVDFDATPAQVARYFAGVRSVLGNRAGIYGGIKVTRAGLAYWRWQTCAWSRINGVDVVDPGAHLYQRMRPTVAHPVAGTDENAICKPIPLWTGTNTASHVAPAAVKPKAKPVTHPNVDNAIKYLTWAKGANKPGPLRSAVIKALSLLTPYK